jgi:hypothetical protein
MSFLAWETIIMWNTIIYVSDEMEEERMAEKIVSVDC